MSLDNLWAGWRHQYIEEATQRERADILVGDEEACVFCRLAESGPPSIDNLVVLSGDWSFVVLNAHPYTSGHVLVLPLRHVGTLGDLTEVESREVWAATQGAVAAIEGAYDPDGLNLGANIGRAAGAGIPSHIHMHVLPRWSGDTNFMTAVAGTRVMPETLPVAWQKLTEAWPRGSQTQT